MLVISHPICVTLSFDNLIKMQFKAWDYNRIVFIGIVCIVLYCHYYILLSCIVSYVLFCIVIVCIVILCIVLLCMVLNCNVDEKSLHIESVNEFVYHIFKQGASQQS